MNVVNVVTDIRRFDHKLHNWEHNLLLSSEKIIHSEAFWMILAILLMFLGLVFLTIFAGDNPVAVNMYQFPFGPMY